MSLLSSVNNTSKLHVKNALSVVGRVSFVVEQAVRILSMQLVLTPAAYALPRKMAMQIANATALLLLVLPIPGFHAYRQMRSAFGKDCLSSLISPGVG